MKIRKSTLGLSVAIAVLLAGNVYSAYHTLDCGVSLTYLQDSFNAEHQTAAQLKAILPLVAQGANKEAIIAAVMKATRLEIEPFEKDGYFWFGSLGLKFDQSGRLTGTATN